jgi:NAD(P)-dependent dehydrogenase (short-subunit alcohol dehydrogenase family)
MTDTEFAGKVALVTGAASGIGAATASALSARGARVALVDMDADALASQRDTMEGALSFAVDVTDTAAVDSAVADVVSTWGRVDILVNCAASFIAAGADATRAEWERSLGVNVVASAMLSSRVSAHMPPGSAIVNVSSISAHAAQPDRWTYNASKAAILALTRGQALDFRRAGIRVNAVSPGWIWTAEVSKAAGGDREKWEPVWGRYHLLERLGEAHEVAEAVLFLASARASFITGTELLVDGGYSAMGPEGLGDTATFAGSN